MFYIRNNEFMSDIIDINFNDENTPEYLNPNKHPSFRLALNDIDFMRRPEMRGDRLANEYKKAEYILGDWGIKSTITVFGSARIKSPQVANSDFEDAKNQKVSKNVLDDKKAAVKMSRFYDDCVEFTKMAAELGGSKNPYGRNRHNVIASGGGPGIMEAANKGAWLAGAPNIGFGVELPFESGNNNFITPPLSFNFHYFAIRKFHMVQRASAVVVFPGGLGSMDEFAEAMTLRQTNKSHPFLTVLYGKEYWERVIDFDYMADCGMISRADKDLIIMADTPEEAWFGLVDAGLEIPE